MLFSGIIHISGIMDGLKMSYRTGMKNEDLELGVI